MSWVEAQLRPGVQPAEFYFDMAEKINADSEEGLVPLMHHFYDEPWWPGAYVVRVRLTDGAVTQAAVEECGAVEQAVPWDPAPDQEVYGDFFGWATRFFEAGSLLSLSNISQGKLVHCYLNAQGLNVRQEFVWALRFAFGRATLRPRLWWRSL